MKLRNAFKEKWVKRIDRYIIAKFLGTYFFAIALIISIAVVFDINENLDKFLSRNAPVKAIIFDYYLNFIPYFSNLFSPLFVFIAVIFFTSKLAENSEIIAMLSTGMSFKRLMRPYMISAAFIALLTYGLGAYVIPQGSEKRINFENEFKKKRSADVASNIQMEVDTAVIIYIDKFDNKTKTAWRLSLDKFENKKLVSRLTARNASYDTLAAPNHWKVRDYMIRELKGDHEVISSGTTLDTIIPLQPQDMMVTKGQQETMTSPELQRYVTRQRQRGFANIKEFEIEYHKRIAMSFASFILTTIGLALSSRKVKGGMGLHLGIGLALSFSYILFQTISATFAVNANVPPMLAVWIPNLLYTLIAVYLYRKAPQ